MANIKSQIKRNRQNDKRRLRNRAVRGTARISVRTARTAIDAGVPESKAALMAAISALDKAAEKGVVHKNNAARRKSRLMKAFAKMEPAPVEAAMVEPVAESEAVPVKAKSASAAKAESKSETKPAAAKAKKATASKSTAAKKPAAKPASKAKKA